jgi:tRNA-dihydrouridine synthase A
LLAADPELFGEAAPHATMKDVFEAMVPYIEAELAQGTRLHSIVRHLHGLFRAVPGARAYRRQLGNAAATPNAGTAHFASALALVLDGECKLSGEPELANVAA